MTRERAIEVLKAWDLNWSDSFTANEFEQAFAMAISTLSIDSEYIRKSELLGKTVRRNSIWNEVTNSEGKGLEEIVNGLPTYSFPEELSEDGTLTVHVSDGSKVNRVLVMGDNIFGGLYYPDSAENKGEPKTGHWIEHVEHCESIGAIPSGLGAYKWCSNCDCGIDVMEWHRNNYNFCPNCGADMRGVSE